MSIEIIAAEAGAHIESFVARGILTKVTEKILKKDPFNSAIEQTLDELKDEKPEDWVVLEDIYRNREKIFDKIEITDEITLHKTLADNGVESETSSRLSIILIKKFREIIKETAAKNPEIFYPFVIKEFETIGADNKEIVTALKSIARYEKFYLDRIIEYFEKLEKKEERINYLIKIETELKKDKVKEGQFFRNEGPLWIDFEDGYVVKRHEVEKIKDAFKAGSLHIMLVGDAASGKSVIARNVGYELANETDVFYINSKMLETHRVDTIFESILKLKDNTLVIIEDAHLYPEHCNDLIKQINDKEKKDIKLLFTARLTYNRCRVVAELDSCLKFTLEAFDSAYAIIKKYADKNRLLQPSSEETKELINQSKESLWVLAYFLMAWEPGRQIDINQIDEKAYNDLKELDNKYKINSSYHVILALAVFYQYEILVEKPFLTHELKLDEITIKKLIDVGEIRESEGFLSLYHSTLAELYLKTSEIHYDLVDSLLYKLRQFDKTLLHHGDFALKMLQYYLRCEPKNYDDVFLHLRPENFINDILRNEKTRNVVYKLLNQEPDIEKMARCVAHILNDKTDKSVFKSIINIVKSRINIESDVRKIGNCILYISFARKKIGELLSESLDLNNLRIKIEKEPDIEKIGGCVGSFSYASRNVGKLLNQTLDIDNLKSKIIKESNIEKIRLCLLFLIDDNFDMAKMLVQAIDLSSLTSKIEKEPDIEKIGVWADILLRLDIEIAEKLFQSINLDNLKSKIEKEEDLRKIGDCIRYISYVGIDIAGKLFQTNDLNNFKSKIEKEPDIEKLVHFIRVVSLFNNEVGKEFIDVVKPKIESELDGWKICRCFNGISLAYSEVGRVLFEIVRLDVEKEQDIKYIGDFAKGLYLFNNAAAKALIESVNLNNLKSKIEKEPDIEKVKNCISDISYVNREVGKTLCDMLGMSV